MKEDYGWISPDGTFYQCKNFEHAEYADKVLKKNERCLENQGWIKITSDFINGRCVCSKHYLISQEQHNTLLRHGFTEKELEDDCLFVME